MGDKDSIIGTANGGDHFGINFLSIRLTRPFRTEYTVNSRFMDALPRLKGREEGLLC